jgi:hypothetical protein
MFTDSEKLINIENYTLSEIWEKFLMPGNKDTYTDNSLRYITIV